MLVEMMQAQTAGEKAEATEQAVDRVRLTLEWLQGQKAMTPMQVEYWDHLVCSTCMVQSLLLMQQAIKPSLYLQSRVFGQRVSAIQKQHQ